MHDHSCAPNEIYLFNYPTTFILSCGSSSRGLTVQLLFQPTWARDPSSPVTEGRSPISHRCDCGFFTPNRVIQQISYHRLEHQTETLSTAILCRLNVVYYSVCIVLICRNNFDLRKNCGLDPRLFPLVMS